MPEWIDLPIPTAAHIDFVAARQGDQAALYRVMMRAREDPNEHERVRREIEEALRNRWASENARVAAERAVLRFGSIEDELLRLDA